MKKFVLPLLFIGILFVACKEVPKEDKPVIDENVEIIDDHTAEMSLDISGTYEGTLPCADCEGIRRTLILNEDKTYKEISVYKDKDNTEFVENGTWMIKENIITLKDSESGEIQGLFAGENFVKYLDQENNEIKGELADYYILKKKNY
jgi:uncharacterized lipoprotein NlpE involved in copper resistance